MVKEKNKNIAVRQCRVEGGTTAVEHDGEEPLKAPSQWKPLLLLIPLRLGLSDINPVYINGLKVCHYIFINDNRFNFFFVFADRRLLEYHNHLVLLEENQILHYISLVVLVCILITWFYLIVIVTKYIINYYRRSCYFFGSTYDTTIRLC